MVDVYANEIKLAPRSGCGYSFADLSAAKEKYNSLAVSAR
jgi:hypothetical protein